MPWRSARASRPSGSDTSHHAPRLARTEHLLDLGDEFTARNGDLCRTLFDPRGATLDRFGELCARKKILQRDLAASAFVGALDDGDRGTTPVGVFELRLHSAVANVAFGANLVRAQFSGERETGGTVSLVQREYSYQRRQARHFAFAQCVQQSADANGDPRCRNALAGEPRDKVVVAAAARNRPKDDQIAFLILHRKRQLRLKNRA